MSRNTFKRVRKGERNFEVEYDDSGRLLPVFQDLLRRSVEVWAEQHWLPTSAARQLLIRRTRRNGGWI